MKKLLAFACILCLGFVFTVGCKEEPKPKGKEADKKPAAGAEKDKGAAPAAPAKEDPKK
jgi:hypothetical protein